MPFSLRKQGPARLVAVALLALSPHVSLSVAHAHGDLHEQIVQLTRRLAAEPGNAALFHKRGELHRAHGDYQAALLDYARAEQLDPALTATQLSRGRALLETGKNADAVVSLSRFLLASPGHAQGLLLRARGHAKLGFTREAELDYAAALAVTPDPLPDLFLERADNLMEAGAPERALEVLDAATKRLGRLVTLELAALRIERRLKRYDQALARVDRMLADSERKESLLAQRAEVLVEAGRSADALDTGRAALAAIAALPVAKRKLPSTKQLERDLEDLLARAK